MDLTCPKCNKKVHRLFIGVDEKKGTIYVCKNCLVKINTKKGKEKK
jgi:transcription elongation factor Elf1